MYHNCNTNCTSTNIVVSLIERNGVTSAPRFVQLASVQALLRRAHIPAPTVTQRQSSCLRATNLFECFCIVHGSLILRSIHISKRDRNNLRHQRMNISIQFATNNSLQKYLCDRIRTFIPLSVVSNQNSVSAVSAKTHERVKRT